MTLPIYDSGPSDAPAILFLHGFMGSGADWNPVADRLAESFRCLTVDLPGHGEAVDLPDACYTVPNTAKALAATLDEVGVERAGVVGYSMGGRIGLYLALRHPGRVARLVVASASPGLRTATERADRRRLDADRGAAIVADFDVFLQTWAELPIFALEAADRAAFVQRRAHNRPDELARSLRGAGTGAQPSLWDDFGRLAVPTLAVAGGRDRKFVDLAFEMAVAGPTVMPLVVPAGHAVPAERPDLFAALVGDFFRDLPLTRQPVPI